jgi:NADH:ubiquinone reductase (H+-translocating)
VDTFGERKRVVIVGGGFAGLACARELAKTDAVYVTLIDRNNFHQFQPLLYQVATAELGTAMSLLRFAKLFEDGPM